MRHAIATLGLGLAVLLPLACANEPQTAAEPLVRAYIEAWNAGDAAGLAKLLDEDAVWQIGMARVAGRENILAVLEYDRALNAQFSIENLRASADTVDCELVRSDDLLDCLGLPQSRHFTRLRVSGGRILEIVPRGEPLQMALLRARYAQFAAWLRVTHPDALPQLQGAQGGGPLSAEAAQLTLQLAREWRAAEGAMGADAGGRSTP